MRIAVAFSIILEVEKAEPKQKASVLPPYYCHLASHFLINRKQMHL